MIFNKRLSSQMSRAIKANSTTTERATIAEKHLISVHTLNSVINMQRNVVKSNIKAIVDIIQIAISNANKSGISLSHYVETTKAAEAAQLNERKQSTK